MRFKKWAVICALLGITIFYDLDYQIGAVWINNSGKDATILASHKTNTVVIYDADGKVVKHSFESFVAVFGKELLENMKAARVKIAPQAQKPEVKEEPGIKY